MDFFYSKNIEGKNIILNKNEMIHCVRSLRKKINDFIYVSDGNGVCYYCKIIKIESETCRLQIVKKDKIEKKIKIHLFISPTKNHKRIEWMLEKLVEVGIYRITFLICKNSIRKTVNLDRLNKIALSAMKQTQNCFLPIIDDCLSFNDAFELIKTNEKYIAHLCYDNIPFLFNSIKSDKNKCIFIGPEGDFSKDEVSYALNKGFVEVSLGNSRLRTETSGLISTVILNLKNE